MNKHHHAAIAAIALIAVASVVFVCLHSERAFAVPVGTHGSELWGYFNVRAKAHIFWWYYKSPDSVRVSSPVRPWPTILWLQGGPYVVQVANLPCSVNCSQVTTTYRLVIIGRGGGGSGVGRGNFQEIGPLDVNLKPRNSTWLHIPDLIFVDHPVGVGFSYTDDPSALATTDAQAASDAIDLIKALPNKIPGLKSSPLYIVGESYGGKFAAMIGASLANSIRAGHLDLILGGKSLFLDRPHFLEVIPNIYDTPTLLRNCVSVSNDVSDTDTLPTRLRYTSPTHVCWTTCPCWTTTPSTTPTEKVTKQTAEGQFAASLQTFTDLLDLIDSKSASVNVYNFLTNGAGKDLEGATKDTPINDIMNGVIKRKLKIIPKNLKPRDYLALLLLLSLLCPLLSEHAFAVTSGAPDGSELWGYVQVRPKAHLFWWYYKSLQRVSSAANPWPTILWLQGGPGGSGSGHGNFLEIGPLDVNLNARNSTWLQKADLIFVDLPVGGGYSYAEDPSALVTTDSQAATDGTELLKALAEEIPSLLQGSPLFLVGESYGGKLAAMIGASVARAIHAGELKLTLGGVVLGDSWISPEDFALSHARLLQDVSRLDDNAVADADNKAATVKGQIAAGQFAKAEKAWTDLLDLIDSKSGSINMFNFLLDTGVETMSSKPPSNSPFRGINKLMKYSTYLDNQASGSESNTIGGIMNGIIKQKLKIIPKDVIHKTINLSPVLSNSFSEVLQFQLNCRWQEASIPVDELLSCGVNVSVYNGQQEQREGIVYQDSNTLDVICPTIGVEAWVQKLKWDGLKNFLSLPRQPLHYCDTSKLIKAFVRSYKNLHFYWILEAGHSVPVDQPCVALSMISSIIHSPARHWISCQSKQLQLSWLVAQAYHVSKNSPCEAARREATARDGGTVVSAVSGGTNDGSERWGYAQVRPKAHLFWWYYRSPQRVSSPGKPWPTVLWLQGGPGSSGVGLGNFLEIGPLDATLKPRASTWLQKADLIFVDNPVGTGYSYVEGDDDSLLVTTDGQAAADLTALLRALAGGELPSLKDSPLFVVAESYGGKYAAALGVSLARAIRAGELRLTLGGVAIGDSWISPEDFALSYGPLLLQVSRLDSNGADAASKKAQAIKQHIAAGRFKQAQSALSSMLTSIVANSGHVDVYNFLLDSGMDPVAATAAAPARSFPPAYSTYLDSKLSIGDSIRAIMNGAVKEKLHIIPKDVVWEQQSYTVYNALINDFMKPRIQEVDELLSYGVNVTVYNGQLDVICSTVGAEAWIQKLKWDGLKNFLSIPRQPLHCGSSEITKGFVRSYKNLHFYWILGAGHFSSAVTACAGGRRRAHARGDDGDNNFFSRDGDNDKTSTMAAEELGPCF
uniref:Carboxypeptidase n=1 Tax=Leersia perrieri TaxID=77586 RepID=A0A0D9VUT5_9ORYZ